MMINNTTIGELRARQQAKDVRSAPNPFRPDANGKRNLTAMSRLIKEQPARARELCEAAGDNWRTYAPYPDNAAGAEQRRRDRQRRLQEVFG